MDCLSRVLKKSLALERPGLLYFLFLPIMILKVEPCMQDGATEIPDNQPLLTVEDLADQVAEVLDHFGYAQEVFLLSSILLCSV